MTTWEEIRDEIAGMLADGQPMEDVISNLEQRKNEMAKANLIEAIEQMKKPKPMTNDEWRRTCSTEEFAKFLNLIIRVGPYENEPKDFWEHVYGRGGDRGEKSIVVWLKQPHSEVGK